MTLPDVSRETSSDGPSDEPPYDDVSRETGTIPESSAVQDKDDTGDPAEHDTPIAREAAHAVHVLNVRQEQWPRPEAPRVITVARPPAL